MQRTLRCLLTHPQEQFKFFDTPELCLDSICIANEVDSRRFGTAKRQKQYWNFYNQLMHYIRRFGTAKRLKQCWDFKRLSFWLQYFKNQNIHANLIFIVTFGNAKPTRTSQFYWVGISYAI
jgi:hypothetical protein